MASNGSNLHRIREIVSIFEKRPGLTRVLGVAEAAFGVWWANRLVAR